MTTAVVDPPAVPIALFAANQTCRGTPLQLCPEPHLPALTAKGFRSIGRLDKLGSLKVYRDGYPYGREQQVLGHNA